MPKILVTGASGFIGKSLIELLLKAGYSVKAACRSTPQIDFMNYEGTYEWQHYDLANEIVDFCSLLDDIDIVVHLAAMVHKMNELSKYDHDAYRIINTQGTEILAKQAAKRGIERFIFLSTIKVNGEVSYNKMMSADDTPHPQDSYAVSKYEAEKVLVNVEKELGMEYVILRSPLVYGPGVRANFLRLLKVNLKGYPLPFAAIDNLRSMIYVKNLADILLNCIYTRAAANKIYLVKDIDISTPDLIRAIANAFGHRVLLVPIPLFLLKLFGLITGKKATIDRLTESLVVDDAPIRDDFGWKPPIDLDSALGTTVDWFRETGKND